MSDEMPQDSTTHAPQAQADSHAGEQSREGFGDEQIASEVDTAASAAAAIMARALVS